MVRNLSRINKKAHEHTTACALTWVLVTVISVGIVWFGAFSAPGRNVLVATLVGSSIVHLFGIAFFFLTKRLSPLYRWLGILTDSALIFLAVFYSGGLESPALFILILPIIIAWYHLETERIVFHTTVSVIFLTALVLVSGSNASNLVVLYTPNIVFILVAALIAIAAIRVVKEDVIKLVTNEEETSQILAEIEVTSELTTLAPLSLPLPRTFRPMMPKVAKHMGVSKAGLFLYQKEDRSFALLSQVGLNEDNFPLRIPLSGSGSMASALDSNSPVRLSEMREKKNIYKEEPAFLRKENVDTVTFIPLLFSERPMGVLALFDDKNNVLETKIELLAAIVRQLSLALFNSVIYQELSSSHAELTKTVSQLEDSRITTASIMEDLEEERNIALNLSKRNTQLLEKTKVQLEKNIMLYKELDEAKLKDEAILTSISDGLFVIDNDQKIIFWNRAAEVITGFKAPEVIGGDCEKPLTLSNNKHLLVCSHKACPNLLCIKTAKKQVKENVQIQKKDGGNIFINYRVSPDLSVGGKVIGAVIAFSDVTREVELQKVKDEFLSIAAHDIRTPLTAISGNLEMVLHGDAGQISEESRPYIEDSFVGSERLLKLVRDMLSASHLEEGRVEFAKDTFDIRDRIEHAVSALVILARQSGLKLRYDRPRLPQVVRADLYKTDEVIYNLIGNALKYTKKGGITISNESAGGVIATSVRDTGVGIKNEDFPKLFQKYSQVGEMLHGFQDRTGLGLYIVRQYVKKMGGSVSVKSRFNKGSTFTFALPKPKRKVKKV